MASSSRFESAICCFLVAHLSKVRISNNSPELALTVNEDSFRMLKFHFRASCTRFLHCLSSPGAARAILIFVFAVRVTMKEQKSAGAVEAMEVAEASRETTWEKPSFVGDLFMGKLSLDLIHPFPSKSAEDKAVGDEFLDRLGKFLSENVDADEIDRTGEYRESFSKDSKSSARGDEDPEGVRRAGVQRHELQPRDRSHVDLVRLDRRVAFGAPVDRGAGSR